MSLGPAGGIGPSAAGSPLAQTKGSDVERADHDAAVQKRRLQSDQKADSAAGVGEADGEDHETDDRDADGRRLWENRAEEDASGSTEQGASAEKERTSKDTTGQAGNLLDLSG